MLDEPEAERLGIDAFDRALEAFLEPGARRPRRGSSWSPPTPREAAGRWCAPCTRGCAAAASATPRCRPRSPGAGRASASARAGGAAAGRARRAGRARASGVTVERDRPGWSAAWRALDALAGRAGRARRDQEAQLKRARRRRSEDAGAAAPRRGATPATSRLCIAQRELARLRAAARAAGPLPRALQAAEARRARGSTSRTSSCSRATCSRRAGPARALRRSASCT